MLLPNKCPSCNNKSLSFRTIEFFSIKKEVFILTECRKCGWAEHLPQKEKNKEE
jgi:predicted nucleic-acid-binding Zn-ribbon protein